MYQPYPEGIYGDEPAAPPEAWAFLAATIVISYILCRYFGYLHGDEDWGDTIGKTLLMWSIASPCLIILWVFTF